MEEVVRRRRIGWRILKSMKSAAFAIFFLLCGLVHSEPIDLGGSKAEDFDWDGFFAQGDSSTAAQMILTQRAVGVLERRLDELCREYCELMTKRGDLEGVKLFNALQENWREFADSEVAFVGASWEGGSGQKAAVPQHRFRLYLRRVKELKELKAQSLFLNE